MCAQACPCARVCVCVNLVAVVKKTLNLDSLRFRSLQCGSGVDKVKALVRKFVKGTMEPLLDKRWKKNQYVSQYV